MTARRVKIGDVVNFRVTFKAVARCRYGNSVEGRPDDDNTPRCTWTHVPSHWERDADVRRAAREHVVANPQHEVDVEVRDVSNYYVQRHVLAALTAEFIADGDD